MKMKRFLCLASAMITLVLCFTGCSNSSKDKNYETLDDFKSAKIGILTGSIYSVLADELFPEAEKVDTPPKFAPYPTEVGTAITGISAVFKDYNTFMIATASPVLFR